MTFLSFRIDKIGKALHIVSHVYMAYYLITVFNRTGIIIRLLNVVCDRLTCEVLIDFDIKKTLSVKPERGTFVTSDLMFYLTNSFSNELSNLNGTQTSGTNRPFTNAMHERDESEPNHGFFYFVLIFSEESALIYGN